MRTFMWLKKKYSYEIQRWSKIAFFHLNGVLYQYSQYCVPLFTFSKYAFFPYKTKEIENHGDCTNLFIIGKQFMLCSCIFIRELHFKQSITTLDINGVSK